MEKSPEDDIITTALLKRFTDQRLPHALDLEKRVMAGEKLGDTELQFLELVVHDAQYILRYSDKYPEYQKIVSKAIKLYSDITEKAAENEKKNR